MPTLITRYSCIIALLAVTLAQAEDMHIKKNITVGGNFVSSTEISIKGARERTVSQAPTGNTLTLRQCDLKRTLTINEQTQTYLVVNDPQDEAALKAAAMVTGAPMADSAAFITETIAVTDTGERKTMFGYSTRHLKTTVSVEASKTACSQVNQKYEIDGWYVDLGKDIANCQQFLPPIRQADGCNDQIIRHRSGSAKTAYPMSENILIHNVDGSTTNVGVAVSQISKQTLEAELFDVPAGYRQVNSLAELNGAPHQQAAQATQATPTAPLQTAPAASSSPQKHPAFGGVQKAAMLSQVMHGGMPASLAAAGQQMTAQQTQPAGSPNGAQMIGGMPAIGGNSVTAPQALGAKARGKIRIGIAPPDAQLGQGNNASADYSTPIRNAVVALMSGPAVEVAPLDSHIAMQLQAEAQQKQCDYILYSGVTVKHGQSGGFGKFMKMGSMAANMTPMGAMAHGMGGVIAAQAASQVASQVAQQQAINQLAGFNGQIKSKDDVAVQYQLVATGQTTPMVQNSLQGKAKSDGEDVLTPLLQQAATTVLTEVTAKK